MGADPKVFHAPRFDGAAAWASLPANVRAELGPTLLEFLCAQRCLDATDGGTAERAAAAALDLLDGELMALLEPVMPVGFFYGAPVPLPSRIARVCQACGCTERDACIHGDGSACGWAAPDLCTVCIEMACNEAAARADFGAEPHDGWPSHISAGEVGDGGTVASPHSGGDDSARPLPVPQSRSGANTPSSPLPGPVPAT
jgi:hypothetical protein